METDNNKIKISVREVADVLGWNYQTATSIKKRRSPVDKYQKFIECEQKLMEARKKIQLELQTETK